MTRRDFLQTAVSAAAFVSLASQAAPAAATRPRAVPSPEDALAGPPTGPWRRLFLDSMAVEEQAGLSRVFHAAEKHPASPVLSRDRPWETGRAISGPYVYGTVLWDGGRLRLWYQLLNPGNAVAYAESDDGLTWIKPSLDLMEYNSSKANNLVVSAAHREVTGGECHNPSVIGCPWAEDPAQRYALFGFDGSSGHARVAFSPDGRRWRYVAETKKRALFTSSDVVNFFWDPYAGRYAVTWKSRNRRGRAVGVAWSADGLAWTKPLDGPVFVADDLDPDATQISGMPVFPYQGLYLGLPWLYHARYFKHGTYSVERLHEAQEDSPRHLDVQLAWSWDLINWTRPPGRPVFLGCGGPGQFDSGMVVTARAPVVVGDRLFLYYGGCDGVHDQPRVNAAIGLATLRLDGFCSMRAGPNEGWLITRRELFHEAAVAINARTAANGSVAAEILDRRNRVLPGFSRAECAAFTGDAVRHVLRWTNSQWPAGRRDPDWKIRFWLKDADLYSYLPQSLEQAGDSLPRPATVNADSHSAAQPQPKGRRETMARVV